MTGKNLSRRARGVFNLPSAAQRWSPLTVTAMVLMTESAAAQGLADRVVALEEITRPAAFTVNCDTGQTIGDALNQARSYLGPVAINISGVCVETVTVNRSNTTLRSTTGAEIRAPGTDDTALRIDSSQRVNIVGLAITQGLGGVRVGGESHVTFVGVRITDHGFHGLGVDAGAVFVRDSFIERNGGAGVFAWRGSRVTIDSTLIADSGERGLELQIGAAGLLGNGTRLTRNMTGIGLWIGSALQLRDTAIEFNVGAGLTMSGASSAWLGDGVVIQNNTQDGVRIGDSSVLSPLGIAPAVAIENNTGRAVTCEPPPAVPQLVRGTSWFSSAGNTLGVTNCPLAP